MYVFSLEKVWTTKNEFAIIATILIARVQVITACTLFISGKMQKGLPKGGLFAFLNQGVGAGPAQTVFSRQAERRKL